MPKYKMVKHIEKEIQNSLKKNSFYFLVNLT